MDLLLSCNVIEIPSALVKEEIQALRNQTRSQVQGGSGTMELPDSLFEEQAKRRVKLGLLMSEIIKQNQIKADRDRVRGKIEEFAASYEDPDEVVKHYLANRNQMAAVENLVLEDQVVDWVLQQVETSDEQSSFSALTAIE
jgi:trigger factor